MIRNQNRHLIRRTVSLSQVFRTELWQISKWINYLFGIVFSWGEKSSFSIVFLSLITKKSYVRSISGRRIQSRKEQKCQTIKKARRRHEIRLNIPMRRAFNIKFDFPLCAPLLIVLCVQTLTTCNEWGFHQTLWPKLCFIGFVSHTLALFWFRLVRGACLSYLSTKACQLLSQTIVCSVENILFVSSC